MIRRVILDWDLIAAYGLLAAILSLWLGQDMNWDLRNYHFYNPHFLLGSRFDRDVLAAGLQSFLNPILDVPFYVAVRLLNIRPIVIGLMLGMVHGLNLWLVHTVTVMLMHGERRFLGFLAGATAAITSAFGAAFYSELANTMGDNTFSVLVLAGLVVMLAGISDDRVRTSVAAALAGLLAGLAAGAKLVAASYFIGIGVAGITSARTMRVTWAVRFVICACVGALVSGGYWAWLMFNHFGSPLFPYYNAIFRSPLMSPTNLTISAQYLPRNVLQGLLYPFLFATRQSLVAEMPFRDGRFAAAYLCIILVFLWAVLLRSWRGRSLINTAADARLVTVMIFWTVSYFAWLRMFSIYRYAVPLELLTLPIVLGSLCYVIRDIKRSMIPALVVSVLLMATTIPLDWGRVPWSRTYFGIDEAALSSYQGATILMDDMPNAYLIPYFPKSARFLRIRGNWGRARLEVKHEDELFVLETRVDSDVADKDRVLSEFGLRAHRENCQLIRTNSEISRICRLTPISTQHNFSE